MRREGFCECGARCDAVRCDCVLPCTPREPSDGEAAGPLVSLTGTPEGIGQRVSDEAFDLIDDARREFEGRQ